MGWVVLPGLFISVVGSMLYQLIEPGAKSENLIDESCFNKQPPEHRRLQSGYMTRKQSRKSNQPLQINENIPGKIIDAPKLQDVKYCNKSVVCSSNYNGHTVTEPHIVSPLRHCWYCMDSVSTCFCPLLVIFIHFPASIPCVFSCIGGTLPGVHGRFNRISEDFSP